MPEIHVLSARNAYLSELCKAIAFVRKESVFREVEYPSYPDSFLNLLNRVQGPNAYRYWGTLLLKNELEGSRPAEMSLVNKLLQRWVFESRKYNYTDNDQNNLVKEMAIKLNNLLKIVFEDIQLSEVIHIQLFPLVTCPPPQLGRFGASLRKAQTTAIMVAFGAPPVEMWREFQIDVSFLFRGCLHYIAKEWLNHTFHADGLKREVRDHLVKLLPVLLQQKYNMLPYDLNDILYGHDAELFKWSSAFFDKDLKMHQQDLFSCIQELNSSWPPLLRTSIRKYPDNVIRLIQDRTRFFIDDPFKLLSDGRWVSDFFRTVGEDEKSHAHKLLILHWECEEAKYICFRNGIEMRKEHYCLLIDREASKWQLVLLCPCNKPARIESVILTQIETHYAFIDSETGRKIS